MQHLTYTTAMSPYQHTDMLLIDKATEMQLVLIELSIIHSHKTLVVFFVTQYYCSI